VNGSPALADRLLGYLRGRLGAPALGYAELLVAIKGGHDTAIFAFRVAGGPAAWSGPLILRLQGGHQDPRRSLREQATQNAVADLGYPAPRVLDACADAGVLGGGFLVMERAVGRPMLDAQRTGVARALVELQSRLHALPTEPFLRAVDAAGGRALSTFDGLFAHLAARAARRAHDGLRAAMDWLLVHRPPTPARPAICHGDFHPQNVLMAGGAVTAVLDWPNAIAGDPAYDIAATRIILGLVPMSLSSVPAPLRGVAHVMRVVILRRYLAGMLGRRPIAPEALAYYEAAACMRQLVRIWEARLDAAERGTVPGALDASVLGDRLVAHFARISGVRPALPPVPR
jgi:aminoglycoside phosphotransferase (APT) family kinase protein